MGKYDKLFTYISYFEQADENAGSWIFPASGSPYTDYDPQFNNFIKDVYQSDILDTNYLEHLAPYMKANQDIRTLIPTADLDLLIAIFTYFIRQDRFCEGLWIEAIVKKTFFYILNRLKTQLTDYTLVT